MYKPVLLALILFFSFPVIANAQVVINEFQVAPDQWIELYNKGDSDVDISGWTIDDNGGTEKYTVASGTILPSKKCMSFQSGNFNWNTSSSDTVKLLSTAVIEEYTYDPAPSSGVSIGRVADGEGSLSVLSSSSKNSLNVNGQSCLAPSPSPSPTQESSPSPSPSPSSSPSPKPSVKPSVKPSLKPSPSPEVLGEKEEEKTAEVSDEREELYTTEPSVVPEESKGNIPLVAGGLVVGGLGFIGVAAYPLIKQRLSRYNRKNDNQGS